jgi:hypothetical protein
MPKHALRIAAALYAALVAFIVWRAYAKYGPDSAARIGAVGVILLIVVWRSWRILKYIFVGGRTPTAAIGATQFHPSSPKKAPPHP